MLRLSSKHESRSRYRHGRLPGRRSRACQHAHGADERPRADRERARAGSRHHAANREFAFVETRGRRPDRAGEAGPPSLLPSHRPRCRRRARRACGPRCACRSYARPHGTEGSGAAPGADLLRPSRRRSRRADARQHEAAKTGPSEKAGDRTDRGRRTIFAAGLADIARHAGASAPPGMQGLSRLERTAPSPRRHAGRRHDVALHRIEMGRAR